MTTIGRQAAIMFTKQFGQPATVRDMAELMNAGNKKFMNPKTGALTPAGRKFIQSLKKAFGLPANASYAKLDEKCREFAQKEFNIMA